RPGLRFGRRLRRLRVLRRRAGARLRRRRRGRRRCLRRFAGLARERLVLDLDQALLVLDLRAHLADLLRELAVLELARGERLLEGRDAIGERRLLGFGVERLGLVAAVAARFLAFRRAHDAQQLPGLRAAFLRAGRLLGLVGRLLGRLRRLGRVRFRRPGRRRGLGFRRAFGHPQGARALGQLGLVLLPCRVLRAELAP